MSEDQWLGQYDRRRGDLMEQVRRVTTSDNFSFFLFILFIFFFFLETADILEYIAYDVEEVYLAIATAASTR